MSPSNPVRPVCVPLRYVACGHTHKGGIYRGHNNLALCVCAHRVRRTHRVMTPCYRPRDRARKEPEDRMIAPDGNRLRGCGLMRRNYLSLLAIPSDAQLSDPSNHGIRGGRAVAWRKKTPPGGGGKSGCGHGMAPMSNACGRGRDIALAGRTA